MQERVKALIRPIIPAKLHERWKRYRFNSEQAQARGRPLEDVFNEIYERGIWSPTPEDGKFHSGPGSMPTASRGYEDFVAGYLNAHPEITTIVDIGCGDFQVSQRILQRLGRDVRYFGCDVASKVVADNNARHAVPGKITFLHANVAKDTLPPGGIVTIREVFQHLSNDTIQAALANLRKNFEFAIVTEAVPRVPAAPNLDIVSGYRTRDGLNSGVFLELAPYNLKIVDRYEHPVSPREILRTLIVRL
jgi:SAM-dependent methyltransferase